MTNRPPGTVPNGRNQPPGTVPGGVPQLVIGPHEGVSSVGMIVGGVVVGVSVGVQPDSTANARPATAHKCPIFFIVSPSAGICAHSTYSVHPPAHLSKMRPPIRQHQHFN